MDLEVFWTRFAESELERIFKFYLQKAGFSTAKKLVDGIYQKPFEILAFPESGQIEELLKDRKQGFRYLVYKKHFKIIYWINSKEGRIEINDVFDVRQ